MGNIQKYLKIFENIRQYCTIFWNMLIYFKILWNIVPYFKILWNNIYNVSPKVYQPKQCPKIGSPNKTRDQGYHKSLSIALQVAVKTRNNSSLPSSLFQGTAAGFWVKMYVIKLITKFNIIDNSINNSKPLQYQWRIINAFVFCWP